MLGRYLRPVRLGLPEGGAARRGGDGRLQRAGPGARGGGGRRREEAGRGRAGGPGGGVPAVLEEVVGLGRPGGRRGRADGTQVGPVGGGERGGALEQLPLPLLGDLSREEGRRVALQRRPGPRPVGRARGAGWHGEGGVGGLLRRQLVGRRLKLWALGGRQQAVIGQAAIAWRLIGQALVAGVCGALRLERGEGVVRRVRRAHAGGVRAPSGQHQRRGVRGVGPASQRVPRHASRHPPNMHPDHRASGALTPFPSSSPPSA